MVHIERGQDFEVEIVERESIIWKMVGLKDGSLLIRKCGYDR